MRLEAIIHSEKRGGEGNETVGVKKHNMGIVIGFKMVEDILFIQRHAINMCQLAIHTKPFLYQRNQNERFLLALRSVYAVYINFSYGIAEKKSTIFRPLKCSPEWEYPSPW